MRPVMTPELAHAASTDAASERMRKEGRTTWNQGDYDVLVKTYHRLRPCPDDIECGICHGTKKDLPQFKGHYINITDGVESSKYVRDMRDGVTK